MAANRERRVTAGNKLARLLNEEEDQDDFYKTTYGGFEEIEDDIDYKSEESGEDIVDSDFSIDENDEVVSDHEDDGKKGEKKVLTRAYKEPKKPEKKKKKDDSPVKKEKPKQIKSKSTDRNQYDPCFWFAERKSVRKSTTVKSAATAQRVKERTSAQEKRKKFVPSDTWKPTQEELLEEAKITEEENLKSLEKFYKMESEKKKHRPTKKVFTGPTIKYHSVAMPLIEEIPLSDDEEDDVKTELKKEYSHTVPHDLPIELIDSNGLEVAMEVEIACDTTENEEKKPPKEVRTKTVVTDKKCERTFITFSSKAEFRKAFPPRKPPRVRETRLCPFTGRPARYFDPRTEVPFRSVQTFKVIREAYYVQLDQKVAKGTTEGLDKDELEKWIAWRQKQNAAKQAQNRIRIEPSSLHLAQIKM
uniref:Vacuolar protein sorting-associated protein 72 homolog n=1 Tax=Lygus hesperus TaxID=30085 RepID=A0A146LNE8_LYGHE